MHYYGLAVIPNKRVEELGVEQAVAALLAPYSEELEVAPHFEDSHSTFEECQAYYAKKGITVATAADVPDDWFGVPAMMQDGVFGHMSTRNPQGYWDWYEIGGRWCGVNEQIEHDVNNPVRHKVRTVPSDIKSHADFVRDCLDNPDWQRPYTVVTPEGWQSREVFEHGPQHEHGYGFREVPEFAATVDGLRYCNNSTIVVIDYHT